MPTASAPRASALPGQPTAKHRRRQHSEATNVLIGQRQLGTGNREPAGVAADRHHHGVAGEGAPVGDPYRVRVDEPRRAVHEPDAVAVELAAHDVDGEPGVRHRVGVGIFYFEAPATTPVDASTVPLGDS